MGRSLVQKSPTECDVSECGNQNSKMRRTRPIRFIEPRTKVDYLYSYNAILNCKGNPHFYVYEFKHLILASNKKLLSYFLDMSMSNRFITTLGPTYKPLL